MASYEEIDRARGRWKRLAKAHGKEIQSLKAVVSAGRADAAHLRRELDRITAERNGAVRDLEPLQQQTSAALDAQLAAERRLALAEQAIQALGATRESIDAMYKAAGA